MLARWSVQDKSLFSLSGLNIKETVRISDTPIWVLRTLVLKKKKKINALALIVYVLQELLATFSKQIMVLLTGGRRGSCYIEYYNLEQERVGSSLTYYSLIQNVQYKRDYFDSYPDW